MWFRFHPCPVSPVSRARLLVRRSYLVRPSCCFPREFTTTRKHLRSNIFSSSMISFSHTQASTLECGDRILAIDRKRVCGLSHVNLLRKLERNMADSISLYVIRAPEVLDRLLNNGEFTTFRVRFCFALLMCCTPPSPSTGRTYQIQPVFSFFSVFYLLPFLFFGPPPCCYSGPIEDDESEDLPFQVTLLGFDSVRDPCNRWTMKHVQSTVDKYKLGLKSRVREARLEASGVRYCVANGIFIC